MKTLKKYFDFKMGLIGASVMAIIVFFVNIKFGWINALPAAGKQALYTFLMGGILMKLTENLSVNFKNKITAYCFAIIIPTVISVGLTFLVHSLKGTPRPLESTIPTLILAPGGFYWWATKKRKKHFHLTKIKS